ncbi:MAG: dimethyl sulfoxide reductase anchor subunit family protein [Acetobacteraceae bacterium]
MNPAASVIFFTTASGAGYGLLIWLGLLAPWGLLPASPWFGGIALALALALITAGLLSSTFHLGHPERAWRAVSQWRSSWLSREGVAALATYPPAGLFGMLWLLHGPSGIAAVFGVLAALLALVTVLCTGMIYCSLRTIRQWRDRRVVPVYLALALFTGAVLAAALAAFWGRGRAAGVLALVCGLAALALKLAYWRAIDRAVPASTIESATGLGRWGKVRPLDPPHTEENYLLREMGYRVARKHAAKLRRIALGLLFALPLALIAAGLAADAALPLVLAVACAAAGVLVERWLFFAEATHTVTLYYRGV